MKKITVFITILALMILLVIMSCTKKSTDSGEQPPATAWTVMLYGAGNNNLDVSNNNTSYIIQDVQDMEKVGSQGGMEVIAMVASERTGGQAKYYHVEYYPSENPDYLSSTVLEDKGSKDMSDPATLTEFLDYCKTNYPASHYLLVIDDHGAGWPGSCTDELNGGGGELKMPELKNAIAQSELEHLDILTFHACLMAMVEVGYELRDVADYMTACQFTMPMENVLASDLWLGWLKDNLSASPYDLAHKIAESVPERAEFKQKTSHYAMINLAEMTSLGSKIGNFGNILVSEGAAHWDEVLHAWGETHFTQYDNPAYVDLREFANKIKLEPNLSQNNLINTQADEIIASVNTAVPYTRVYVNPGDPNVPRGGLNIHFPYQMQDFDSANYVDLEFRATNWHAFLSTFLRNSRGGPTQGCPTTCAEAAVISLGTPVTQCEFTGADSVHWFQVAIQTGTYRFQLGDFPGGADFDLYTLSDCNTQLNCYGAVQGPEDFSCSFTGSGYLILAVFRYAGSGGYTLLVTQTGEARPDENLPVIAIK